MHVANEKMSGKIFLWAREPVALIKRAMSVPGAIGYPWTEVINNQTRSWTRSLTILAGSGAGVEISIKNRIRSLSWNFYLKTGSGAGVEISIKNRIRSRSWNFYKKLDQESELYYGSFSFRLSFAYVRESWKKFNLKWNMITRANIHHSDYYSVFTPQLQLYFLELWSNGFI